MTFDVINFLRGAFQSPSSSIHMSKAGNGEVDGVIKFSFFGIVFCSYLSSTALSSSSFAKIIFFLKIGAKSSYSSFFYSSIRNLFYYSSYNISFSASWKSFDDENGFFDSVIFLVIFGLTLLLFLGFLSVSEILVPALVDVVFCDMPGACVTKVRFNCLDDDIFSILKYK